MCACTWGGSSVGWVSVGKDWWQLPLPTKHLANQFLSSILLIREMRQRCLATCPRPPNPLTVELKSNPAARTLHSTSEHPDWRATRGNKGFLVKLIWSRKEGGWKEGRTKGEEHVRHSVMWSMAKPSLLNTIFLFKGTRASWSVQDCGGRSNCLAQRRKGICPVNIGTHTSQIWDNLSFNVQNGGWVQLSGTVPSTKQTKC